MKKCKLFLLIMLGMVTGNIFAQKVTTFGKGDTLKWYLNGKTFSRMTAKGASKYDGMVFRVDFGKHVNWCQNKDGCPTCGTSLEVTLIPAYVREPGLNFIPRAPIVVNHTTTGPTIQINNTIVIRTDTLFRVDSMYRKPRKFNFDWFPFYPFLEQIGGREFGEYSYANGRLDFPTYAGLQTSPFRDYLGAVSVGYRGKTQQRFGGLYDHCNCGPKPSVDVWTLRFQAGYNLRVKRNFAQIVAQHEILLSKESLREYGGDVHRYWRPYGATMLFLGMGRQVLISDDRFGGAVVEFKLGVTYDMGNLAFAPGQEWALQLTAKSVFIGKKLAKLEGAKPDGLERAISSSPRWLWNKVAKPVGKGVFYVGAVCIDGLEYVGQKIGGIFRKKKAVDNGGVKTEGKSGN